MTTLPNLDLRRRALARLGWRLFWIGDGFLYHEVIPPSEPPFQMEPDQARLWEEVPFEQISDRELAACPAIESDPAVAIPAVTKFAKERGLNVRLGIYPEGSFSCAFHKLSTFRGLGGIVARAESNISLCEAIALAIIAAQEKGAK